MIAKRYEFYRSKPMTFLTIDLWLVIQYEDVVNIKRSILTLNLILNYKNQIFKNNFHILLYVYVRNKPFEDSPYPKTLY